MIKYQGVIIGFQVNLLFNDASFSINLPIDQSLVFHIVFCIQSSEYYMKPINSQPSLAELTYQTLMDAICDGTLPAGKPLVQEDLANQLGVSRQPIQQAIIRLKAEGLLEDAPGRGHRVPALNLTTMRDHYQIRSALDQLAARLAAQRAAASSTVADKIREQGEKVLEAGVRAVGRNSVKDMVRHDVAFHQCIYSNCGNDQIASTVELHWRFLRRVMGDVLRHAQPPATIWDQHEKILDAIVAGDISLAESRAASHIEGASDTLITVFN